MEQRRQLLDRQPDDREHVHGPQQVEPECRYLGHRGCTPFLDEVNDGRLPADVVAASPTLVQRHVPLLPPTEKVGDGWRGSWPRSRRRAGGGPTPYDAAVRWP